MFEWIKPVYQSMSSDSIGSITMSEAFYLAELFKIKQPKLVVEIGIASGLSSVLLTKLGLQFQKDFSILSIDFSDKFYGDTTRDVGFLAKQYLSDSELEHLSLIVS